MLIICPKNDMDDAKIVCRLCGEIVQPDDSLIEQDRHERCERLTVPSLGEYRRDSFDERSKARRGLELERIKHAAYNVEFRGATVRCGVCRQSAAFLSGSIYAGDEIFNRDMAREYVHPECDARNGRSELLGRRPVGGSAKERRQEQIASRYDAWEAILRSRFGDEWYDRKISIKAENLRARRGDKLGLLRIVSTDCDG